MSRIIIFIFIISISFGGSLSVNGQLTSGLVAYYPFNGSANDAGVNSLNPSTVSNITYTTDQFGNANSAALFNGTSSGIIIPHSAAWNVNQLSISCRVKPMGFYAGACQGNVIIMKGFGIQNGHFDLLYSDQPYDNNCNTYSPTHESFYCEIGNNLASFPATPVITPNTWYCLTSVFDGTTQKLYINGTLAYSFPATTPMGTNTSDVYIGYGVGGSPTYWLNGVVDELRVYNRALTLQEMDTLCNFNYQADTVINKYAAVLSRNGCNNSFLVDTATDFNVGDTILVMQMKGAVIDSSNTPAFGTVTDYKSAGNYEYNVILAKTGNNLTLKYKLTKTYEIPAGLVQFVKVPHAVNYTVNKTHTGMAWTGTKGGVFALNVDNTLTLNNDIKVNGKGFRGGFKSVPPTNPAACSCLNYCMPPLNDSGANKGEGLAPIGLARSYGRGHLANGGGGGNSHDSGGGGGSNAGTGGIGGLQFSGCIANPTSNITGGIGGIVLPYTTNKIFLGGGGGAGHADNSSNSSGGNGGGIIVITANNILFNGHSLESMGNTAQACILGSATYSCHDGMGGGGGGGAIVINANTLTGTGNILTKGGNGADVSGTTTQAYAGPGGGGGGGAVLFSAAGTPASLYISNAGGINGLEQLYNSAWGAMSGLAGQTFNNLVLPFPTVLYQSNTIAVNFTDSVTDCFTRKFKSTTTTLATGVASVLWDFGGGITSPLTSPSYTFSGFGTFPVKLIITDSNGCKDSITKSVIIKYRHFANAGKDTSVCKGAIVTLNATGGIIYSWSPAAQVTSPNAATTVATPAGYPATYIVTVTDSINCVDLDTVIVKLKPGTPIKALPIDTMVCKGSKVQLSASGGLKYSWSNGGLLTDSLIANPIATIPAQTTFVVTGTDEGGCANKDSITVYLRSNPNIVITTPDAGISCNKKSVQLYATGALSYIWHPGIYCNDSLIPSPTVNPTKTTTFTVTGTDFYGCKDTSSIQIIAYYESSVYLPNAFTPDGDGVNDIIRPLGYCGFKLKEFRVYNRWGECVFLSNSLAYGWDGNYKGQRADMGVYSYLIQGTEEDGTAVLKKGNITLLR